MRNHRKLVHKSALAAAIALSCLAALTARSASAHEGEDHSTASNAATLGPEERSVNSVLRAYAGAMTAGDIAAIQLLLVPGDGFSYFEGSTANFGWQSYYDHMAPEMKLFEKPSYRVSNLKPFVSGELALATFDWALDVTILSDQFAGGRHPVAMTGKGTAVLSRIDGQWKIRHLHTAQAPARKPDAASH